LILAHDVVKECLKSRIIESDYVGIATDQSCKRAFIEDEGWLVIVRIAVDQTVDQSIRRIGLIEIP